MGVADPKAVRRRFQELLERALDGWKAKIALDFSEVKAKEELALLASDPVYSAFALDRPEYVLIRLMGRMSISIGRRLGELYDNLPKFVTAARFGLTPKQVAAKIAGLNLDVLVPFKPLTDEDFADVRAAVKKACKVDVHDAGHNGLGIEIRYNFHPNDSARLRKDVAMVDGLKAEGLLPIYLIFSGISPRAEAIDRLTKAGWIFLVGDAASEFTKDLVGLDLGSLLQDPETRKLITESTAEAMRSMVESHAFQAVLQVPPASAS